MDKKTLAEVTKLGFVSLSEIDLGRIDSSLKKGMAMVKAIIQVADNESLNDLGDKDVMMVLDEAWGHFDDAKKVLKEGIEKDKAKAA